MGLGLRERLRTGVGSMEEWLADRETDISDRLPDKAQDVGSGQSTRAASPPRPAPAGKSRAQQFLDNADRLVAKGEPGVRALVQRQVGNAGLIAGNVVGVIDGVKDTAAGLRDAGGFALRLLNPADAFTHERGEAAWDELFGGLHDVGTGAVALGTQLVEDPKTALHDAGEAVRRKRRELDPRATSVAPTLEGEFRRNLGIGRNQGKLLVELAPYAVGGGEVRGALALAATTKASRVAKYIDQGFTRRKANYLAQPYKGMGHHSIIPRRAKLPDFLGGGPVPKVILDSPFNVLAPPGITRGDFYELHYGVDSDFTGARLRGAPRGGGWSGKRLGLGRYSLPERIWRGTPNATRQAIATTGTVGTNPFGIGEE